MSDLLVAASAAVGIIGCAAAISFARRRSDAIRALGRLSAPEPARGRRSRSEQRAFLAGFAERFAATGAGTRFAAYVSRAHPHLTFSDAIAMTLSAAIGGLLVGSLLFPGGPLVFAGVLAGPVILDRVVARAGGRRTARLEQQLPEALALQASALRAGHSTIRSLRVVAGEIPAPLGEEIDMAVREIDLGRSLDQTLGRLAVRASSRDVELWVTAMLVHRTTGGDLSIILDSLADRIRERVHLRGEMRSLTAQGRLSGMVVGAAPLAFFLLLSVTSREQMRILYTTPLGLMLLIGGLALIGAGFFWIRWILRIKP